MAEVFSGHPEIRRSRECRQQVVSCLESVRACILRLVPVMVAEGFIGRTIIISGLRSAITHVKVLLRRPE